MNEILALVLPIIKRTEGQIGTHYQGCHEYHVGCLAAEILRTINEAEHDG